ncbi:MAG: HEAT repeat domain-containing protein [Candidatus Cloacimonetes bacterium]|nr:HEAT repeat domain-containing protein [Candidatus Cloacimonadota bacterium]
MTEPANIYTYKTLAELRGLRNEILSDAHALATWVKALGHKGESEDILLILPCLKHNDGRVRANSIEALELLYHRVREQKILPIFANFLTDQEPRVVSACIKALSSQISQKELKQLVDKVYNPLEPRRCLAVLYLIRHLKLNDCLDMVDMMLTNQSPQIQKEAQKVLNYFSELKDNLLAEANAQEQEKQKQFELQTGKPSQETLNWLIASKKLEDYCRTWEPDFDQIENLKWLLSQYHNLETPTLLNLFEVIKRLPHHELETMRTILKPLLEHPDLCYPCVEFLHALGGDDAYLMAIKRKNFPNLSDAREKELFLSVSLLWYQSSPVDFLGFVQNAVTGDRHGTILLSGIYPRINRAQFSETLWEIGFSQWKSIDEMPLFSLLSQGLIHYSSEEKRQILIQISQKMPESKRSFIKNLIKQTPLPEFETTPDPEPKTSPTSKVSIPAKPIPKSRKWTLPALTATALGVIYVIWAAIPQASLPTTAQNRLPEFKKILSSDAFEYRKGEGIVESLPGPNMLRVRLKEHTQTLILPEEMNLVITPGQKVRFYGEWQDDTEQILVRKVFVVQS